MRKPGKTSNSTRLNASHSDAPHKSASHKGAPRASHTRAPHNGAAPEDLWGIVNVRAAGAKGDGKKPDTRAIQAAIDRAASRGGGTVLVPAGTYLTGSLFMKSRVSLHLEAGAVILASEEEADYPLIESRWEGETRVTHAPLVSGAGLEDVEITGRGTINGQGRVWWERHRARTLSHPRPRLISFSDCTRVRIAGIRAVDSPSWTINPVRCDDVIVDGITIRNPADSPNTDGINPDSCSRVRISNCLVDVGDDCITIKSGVECERPELRRPCRDIAVTNCILAAGHGGIVIGSEMSGGVSGVVISNCVFDGTDRGIRMKSRRGRGGTVEDIRVSNVVMKDVECPFTMNMFYGCGAWGDPVVSDRNARPVDEGTPRFRSISISGMTARGTTHAAAFIHGLAESPVEDVTLRDISVILSPDAEGGLPEMADGLSPMTREGIYVRFARGLSMDRVCIEGQLGPAFRVEDSSNVELRSCGTRPPRPAEDMLSLCRVKGAVIDGRAIDGSGAASGSAED